MIRSFQCVGAVARRGGKVNPRGATYVHLSDVHFREVHLREVHFRDLGEEVIALSFQWVGVRRFDYAAERSVGSLRFRST